MLRFIYSPVCFVLSTTGFKNSSQKAIEKRLKKEKTPSQTPLPLPLRPGAAQPSPSLACLPPPPQPSKPRPKLSSSAPPPSPFSLTAGPLPPCRCHMGPTSQCLFLPFPFFLAPSPSGTLWKTTEAIPASTKTFLRRGLESYKGLRRCPALRFPTPPQN